MKALETINENLLGNIVDPDRSAHVLSDQSLQRPLYKPQRQKT